MLITPKNGNGGWMPVVRAVRSGDAFCVEVADDVLAIDDDFSQGDRTRAFAQAAFRRNVRCILLASGQADRYHLFAKVENKRLRAELRETADKLGLDVRNVIRPPLAPHRLGGASRLLDPIDELEALARLIAPRGFKGLSPRMIVLLRKGDLLGRYATRSEVFQAIVQACMGVGMGFEAAFDLLRDCDNVGGEKLHELEHQRGLRGAAAFSASHGTRLRNTASANRTRCSVQQRSRQSNEREGCSFCSTGTDKRQQPTMQFSQPC